MELTIVKQDKCVAIWLYDSAQLTNYYNNSTNKSVELGVTRNCGTETTKDVKVSDVLYDTTLQSAYIVIDNDFLGYTVNGDALPDSVYRLRLRVTEADGSYTEDSICVAITCAIKCRVAEYIASNLNTRIHYYEYALDNIHNCDKCLCEAGCIIYKELLDIINNGGDNYCSDC